MIWRIVIPLGILFVLFLLWAIPSAARIYNTLTDPDTWKDLEGK